MHLVAENGVHFCLNTFENNMRDFKIGLVTNMHYCITYLVIYPARLTVHNEVGLSS